MSVAEILEELPTLTPEEREKIVMRAVAIDLQRNVSPAVQEELGERLDALDADPSLAVPSEGTMEEVRKLRENLRSQKTADRHG